MSLQLYNTRTRSVEAFAPLDPPRVGIYVCGLTPSAQAHLGHARSFLFFDVLRRYLIHLGFAVTYVQNVTDIDDRSIEAAIATGTDWRAIVQSYYASFKTSMKRLGVREPDREPFATQFVPQICATIARLIEGGYAYVARDGVYYDVRRFDGYGRLSNRKLDELEAGARVEVGEFKRDPLDFALWKFAKPGEPSWPSPWGDGRPGWHIECSSMSHEILDPEGRGFDIHGGGADLIFPHHENEIAQSEPLMAHPPMANVWVHGGLLLFDSRKMSKSLGNFEPLTDLLDRYDPQALRLLFLQTGYSKVMNFTEESAAAANTALRRLQASWRKLHSAAGRPALTIGKPPAPAALLERVERALDDNMNTSLALSELYAWPVDSMGLGLDRAALQAALGEFSYALNLLGLTPNPSWLEEPKAELPADFFDRLRVALRSAQGDAAARVDLDGADAEEAIARVIAVRMRARATKNWAESDRLRDALARCGVVLEDSKEGTTWTIAV